MNLHLSQELEFYVQHIIEHVWNHHNYLKVTNLEMEAFLLMLVGDFKLFFKTCINTVLTRALKGIFNFISHQDGNVGKTSENEED